MVSLSVLIWERHIPANRRSIPWRCWFDCRLNVLRIFIESTAAAVAYGLDNEAPGELTFDAYGNGFLNISAINKETVQKIDNLKNKLQDVTKNSITWIENNQEASKDECEREQKLLEGITDQIMNELCNVNISS
ncbi:unnamed protein product [Rhizophagus irregularis]|nr:unnamed protein product [Rhizophagus irregularis]